MIVFRIEREKYLDETLKGIGTALNEGFRWNSLGTFLVYSSESRALATLEVTAHLDLSEDLPKDRYIVEIEIPDKVEILTIDPRKLPKDWDSKPPIRETQFIGDEFVNSKESAVLKVPSCIIPNEFNYLINPNHPESNQIKVLNSYPLALDGRFQILMKKK